MTDSRSIPSSRASSSAALEAIEAGGIDWGQAEALAYASLLEDGIPIRLSGQDSERGTFAHRHLVMHDPETGETFSPMQNLPGARSSFEVYNSPLSEYAALGFEYGYSVAAPDALVLWEAQFGDFANGAQIVIDQFLAAGRSKWGQNTRLTLLLPHGYEGNGPEHSSARLERFLQLGAEDNIRVANCTTGAQFFHLVRRQALDPIARPLIVMSPKGLLRLKAAGSTLAELADGGFQPVIDDATRRARVGAAARALLREDLLRHRRPRGARRARTRSLSSGSSSCTPSRSRRSRHSLPATRRSAKSSGRRRSRRTWARGVRFDIGSTRLLVVVRPSVPSRTSDERGRRARARATRRHISASRTASCEWRLARPCDPRPCDLVSNAVAVTDASRRRPHFVSLQVLSPRDRGYNGAHVG